MWLRNLSVVQLVVPIWASFTRLEWSYWAEWHLNAEVRVSSYSLPYAHSHVPGWPQTFSGSSFFQEKAISGSCQQAILGIHNSVWVWWLVMGWIPRWVGLWMALPSVSAPHFVSISPPMGILFSILRSIHPSVFLLLELHMVCELHLGYSKLLG